MVFSQHTSPVPLLLRLLLLISFIPLTTQVDITIKFAHSYDDLEYVTCERIKPGVCCVTPHSFFQILGTTIPYIARNVTIEQLLPGDIAAVWHNRVEAYGSQLGHYHQIPGCSSKIMQTGHGPGTFDYYAPPGPLSGIFFIRDGIGGASYISVPTMQLPPTGQMATWLTMEGILGLAWGGGKWFSSDAAARMVGRGGSGVFTSFSKTKRRIVSSEKGTVFAQSPSREVYPSKIQVNGTLFEGGESNLMYTSAEGRVLNLTELMQNGV
ncbi:MAG: hypothetical protein HETSPECPRED_002374 [Heterodermia speciosa]|uniref:Uncharacterized protein n=1 Tax=Heterodermia speciosa TaxID=116794 RepID=A0A8H3J426_9LECA|nr:MAG: hypothetical protein HETSPECPRED_002374 [Heterodermia speciosa]